MSVELDDVKPALQLEAYDTSHDVQLARNLASAIEAVSAYCGHRDFINMADITESTRTFDAGGNARVILDDVHAVTLVEESSDMVSWASRSDYWATPLDASPTTGIESLTAFARFVRVTGKFGYGSEPSRVRDATILYAISLFDRRNSPSGLVAGGEFGPIRISRRTDPTVAELLDPLVRLDRTIGIA